EIMKELKPDIIVLGPDQVFSEEDVQNELRSQGLNVKIVRIDKVCDEHPLCHTQKIIKKILNKKRKYPNR
ncbi:MAG: FAD synthase, partial [Promethearchaeota archaeon]